MYAISSKVSMSGRETAVIVDTFKQPVDKLCYYLVFDNTAKTTDWTLTESSGVTVDFTSQPSTGPYRPMSQYLKDIYGNYATPYYDSRALVTNKNADANLVINENVYDIKIDTSSVLGISMSKYTGQKTAAATTKSPGSVAAFTSDFSDYQSFFEDNTVLAIKPGADRIVKLPTLIMKAGEMIYIRADYSAIGAGSSPPDTLIQIASITRTNPAVTSPGYNTDILGASYTDGGLDYYGAADFLKPYRLEEPGTYYYYLNDRTKEAPEATAYKNTDQPTKDNICYGKIIVTAHTREYQSRVPMFGPMDRLNPGKPYSGKNSMALYMDTAGENQYTGVAYAKNLLPRNSYVPSTQRVTSYHDVYYSCLRSTPSGDGTSAKDLISIPELTKKIIDGDFSSIYLQPDFTTSKTTSDGLTPPHTNAFRKTDAAVSGMKIYPDDNPSVLSEVDVEQTVQNVANNFGTLFSGQEFTAMNSTNNSYTVKYGVGAVDLPLQLVPGFATAHDTTTGTGTYVSRIQAVGGGFFTYKSNETCPVFCMNVPKDFAVMSWEFEYKQYGPGETQDKPNTVYKFADWSDPAATTVTFSADTSNDPDYFRGLNLEMPPLINFLHVPV